MKKNENIEFQKVSQKVQHNYNIVRTVHDYFLFGVICWYYLMHVSCANPKPKVKLLLDILVQYY